LYTSSVRATPSARSRAISGCIGQGVPGYSCTARRRARSARAAAGARACHGGRAAVHLALYAGAGSDAPAAALALPRFATPRFSATAGLAGYDGGRRTPLSLPRRGGGRLALKHAARCDSTARHGRRRGGCGHENGRGPGICRCSGRSRGRLARGGRGGRVLQPRARRAATRWAVLVPSLSSACVSSL